LEDKVVYELIRSKEYPQKRVILLTDYRFETNQFISDQPFSELKTLAPLPNVIYVGAG
jgi:hypothetical protein